jgi:hypothetical protein
MQVQAAPPAALAGMQNSCSMADAGTPPLAATVGRMASSRLPSSAAPARSGS